MDNRLFYSATKRNELPISQVLANVIPKRGYVLEIASGSGEHAVSFQKLFPNITWQASDPDPLCRKSISSWITFHGLNNQMPEPIDIDVEKAPWPLDFLFCKSLQLIVCINLIHISPFSSTKALFQNASSVLSMGGTLFVYGPFTVKGVHTSIGNEKFHQALKSKNSTWGIRDLEEVTEIADVFGFDRYEVIKMPANNFSILFKKSYKL